MISKSYKGFDLISVQDVPDCSSKGIYLRHRKSGLEVFHLLNDDEENLFGGSISVGCADTSPGRKGGAGFPFPALSLGELSASAG